jgi:tRNA-splicing ligase RtcB
MKPSKVRDGVWEFREEGMNVPARVIASDTLLPTIEEGVFRQIANVAKLPGIIEPALVMPDGHYGYGFPIGGVAAFTLDEGVISPGGVGYDINCLPGETRVVTELGSNMTLKELDEKHTETSVQVGDRMLKVKTKLSCPLRTLNKATCELEGGNITHSMSRESDSLYLITTSCGLHVRATAEHPFLTRAGLCEASQLSTGTEVAVSLFEGVEYEKVDDSIIVDYDGMDVSKQCMDELLKRGLIPLKAGSPQLPYLAKLIGYLLGDGVVYFSNGKGYVCAYGKEKDLESIKHDVARIGYTGAIYYRKRDHRIVDQYGVKEFTCETHELHVRSTSLARLLVALGVPVGKKSSTEFTVPPWIMDSSRWIQRLFLAGFFGAELSSPKTHYKTGFYAPILSQNKNRDYVENGRLFFIQLMQLLEGFGIECSKISVRREYKNRTGNTYRIRLLIAANEDNLLRLYRNVGFEYNRKRRILAEIASLYILTKKAHTAARTEAVSRVKRLKAKDLSLKEVQSLLNSCNVNASFIERHYYETAGQCLSLDFPFFNEFRSQCLKDHKRYGCLFDKVASVKKQEYAGLVYDITVEDNHNFIVDGFIVSNCGVRMLATNLTADDIKNKLRKLTDGLYEAVPSGLGSKSRLRYSDQELREVCVDGARWAVGKGFGVEEDLGHMEECGAIDGADPAKISDRARKRGRPQLGTLGSGNHFLEISKVTEIYDENVAHVFGLNEVGQATVMVHCGSRGLGYQVADDYIKVMLDASRKYGISLPDKELACAPLTSREAEDYVAAMYCAVNYAFANRQFITHWVREVFRSHLPDAELKLVYDVCHNIAKFEEHGGERVCVHRKGATRAFSAGRREVPEDYRVVGQPVLVPGDMGTASYVLVGTEAAMAESFGSVCHGAGRVLSRSKAKRTVRGEDVKKSLEDRGEVIRAASMQVLAEEYSGAYKDVTEVVKSVELAGLGRLVAKVTPMGVVKG